MGAQGDLLGIVLEILIWSYEQMVYAQPRVHSGKWDAQDSLGFEIQMDHLILGHESDGDTSCKLVYLVQSPKDW